MRLGRTHCHSKGCVWPTWHWHKLHSCHVVDKPSRDAEAEAISTDKHSCADNSQNVNTVHKHRYDMEMPESQEKTAQAIDKHLCLSDMKATKFKEMEW